MVHEWVESPTIKKTRADPSRPEVEHICAWSRILSGLRRWAFFLNTKRPVPYCDDAPRLRSVQAEGVKPNAAVTLLSILQY